MAGRESRERPASGAARAYRLKRFGLKTENRSRNNGSGQRFIASNGDSRHPTAEFRFDCPIGEGVTVIGLTSGTRTAAVNETIRYSTSYSTMDGCAWIHSVCAPSAWEPSHKNVLRGIEVKHDGTRYVETDRVSASDPLSRLSDGVVNPAGESYGNTIGLKDGTLTWTLLEPMNISRLRVNTHWQDGGGDGISFIRVEYLQNGSETWTVLPNSTKLL